MDYNTNETKTNYRKKTKRQKLKDFIIRYMFQIILIISLASIICVPFVINELYLTSEGYKTVWGGKDVLAYSGTVISAIGTIVLGVVAWRQNIRLLKLEENSFLAQNTGMALLTEVKLSVKTLPNHLGFHEEQILFSSDVKEKSGEQECYAIKLICKIEPLDIAQHISLVNVKKVSLTGSQVIGGCGILVLGIDDIDTQDECQKRAFLELTNDDNRYTRVAISKSFDGFMITLAITEPEKQEFISTVNSCYGVIHANLELSLITNKFVKTDVLCRAVLKKPDYDESEGVYSSFKTSTDEPPMCFWKSTRVINIKDVHIKQLMGGTVNGQDEDAE